MAKNLVFTTILHASTSEVKSHATKNSTIPLYLTSKTLSQNTGLKRNFIIDFYNYQSTTYSYHLYNMYSITDKVEYYSHHRNFTFDATFTARLQYHTCMQIGSKGTMRAMKGRSVINWGTRDQSIAPYSKPGVC